MATRNRQRNIPEDNTQQMGESPQPQQTVLPDTARARLLQRAMEITHHDRNANYGNPEDNFQHIANLWNDFLAVRRPEAAVLTSADVAVMNMLIKVARLGNNPAHYDSTLDIAGYAACLADIQVNLPINY